VTRRASVLGLVALAAVTLLGAKGCENPNPEGVTDRGSVTGRLVDANHQDQPIPTATIQIGTQVMRISPADKGAFTVAGVPTGTQTIAISSPGYNTYTAQVVVRKDQTSELGLIGLQSTTGL
jgi:Carboxypeptidase regulatory-like domain